MRQLTLIFTMTSLACCAISNTASAIPAFQKVFFAEYINDHADPEYAEFVKKKVKCLACHQGKASKFRKFHNAYGEHLEERLDKKADKKDDDKIVLMLKEVAELPYNPDDPNGETYGDRIAAGKLPGAETLEDLEAKPEGAPDEQE